LFVAAADDDDAGNWVSVYELVVLYFQVFNVNKRISLEVCV
jgi:hypothetical protein